MQTCSPICNRVADLSEGADASAAALLSVSSPPILSFWDEGARCSEGWTERERGGERGGIRLEMRSR